MDHPITRSPDHPILAFAVALFLLATAGTLRAQSPLPPEAASAFSRAASLYSDGSAHGAAFVQIYTPAGFTTARRESGALWIQAPQKLRFDYEAPEKKTFTYGDGEGRLYTPDDKQLSIQKLSIEDRARLPIVFLADPAELARQYAVSVEPGAGAVTRVLMKPRAARSDLAWLRLSVGRDGSIEELSYEDAGGNRTEFRFEGWRKEKARPPADFRVTGPPGTRVLQN